MFDSLKKSLKKFGQEVEEKGLTETTFEVIERPPQPPQSKPAPQPAPPAPQTKSQPAPAPTPPPAPRAATPPPTAPTRPAPPHVEVTRHSPEEKARVVKEFNHEIRDATEAAPGAPAEHILEGAEPEEGDRARIPVPKEPIAHPANQPGLQKQERHAAEPHGPSVVTKAPPSATTSPRPAPAPAPASPVTRAVKGKAIDPSKIEDLLWDLELALLESDVALEVVEAIKERLLESLPRIRVENADDVPVRVENALRSALLDVLTVEGFDWDTWILEKTMEKKPVIIMFIGVNGTGKTTSIGRIAHRLKDDGYTCLMAAGDTFRAGAIEQLTQHAENLGVTIIKHKAGSDPAAVAYDAVESAKARMKDVVLLDTAGRMQTNTNLMDEMKKIKRVANPDLVVFVGDSLAGNDAIEQARKFNDAVGIDAVILTKVDTDAKGGAALSIAQAVGRPIVFLGVGQEYRDLIPYDPEWMVERIFEA